MANATVAERFLAEVGLKLDQWQRQLLDRLLLGEPYELKAAGFRMVYTGDLAAMRMLAQLYEEQSRTWAARRRARLSRMHAMYGRRKR